MLEPLAVERLYLDNYFSIAKATRDLGYRPLVTTEQAMVECLPYYIELFERMKADHLDDIIEEAKKVALGKQH